MDLALISVLIAILNVILTMVLLLSLKSLTNDFPHLAGQMLQNALNDVAPTIENAISEGLNTGLKSVAGSVLAKNSAVSRQMKGMEKEIISQSIDQVMPGLGSVGAKYIQKYPFLMGFLQKMAAGQQQKQSKGRGKM